MVQWRGRFGRQFLVRFYAMVRSICLAASYKDQCLQYLSRFIGAEQPPHLKALAPWEGLGDYYRESLCRGGIPDYSFWHLLLSEFQGGGYSLPFDGKSVVTVLTAIRTRQS